MSAQLVVQAISANPVRVRFQFAGNTWEQEWPNRATALAALQNVIQPENNLDLALALVLLLWKQTDPNLTNIQGMVGHTFTISNPVVTMT